MVGDAKNFAELTDSFADWLDKTERSQANTDVIGTQVDHIQSQLAEQQVGGACLLDHVNIFVELKYIEC